MAAKYNPGDTVYIVESNQLIREATVLRSGGGFYTIRFSNGGGIKVRENRLFASKEDAQASIPQKPAPQKPVSHRTPYDYM